MNKSILITNIKSLMQTENEPCQKVCGSDMSSVSKIDDSYLFINDRLISDFGSMDDIRQGEKVLKAPELF